MDEINKEHFDKISAEFLEEFQLSEGSTDFERMFNLVKSLKSKGFSDVDIFIAGTLYVITISSIQSIVYNKENSKKEEN